MGFDKKKTFGASGKEKTKMGENEGSMKKKGKNTKIPLRI